MATHTKQRAGTVVATVLGVDALLHIYWLTGARWPAHDTATLSQAVLGLDASFDPPVLMPLIAVLVTGSAVILTHVGRLPRMRAHLLRRLSRAGVLAVTAGLFARGVGGVAVVLLGHDNALFYRLNLALYTPLCLAMAVAAAATMTEKPGELADRADSEAHVPTMASVGVGELSGEQHAGQHIDCNTP